MPERVGESALPVDAPGALMGLEGFHAGCPGFQSSRYDGFGVVATALSVQNCPLERLNLFKNKQPRDRKLTQCRDANKVFYFAGECPRSPKATPCNT
jgi:hypothetical protein